MTKRDKRIRKLFTNPKTISFAKLDSILDNLGFECRQPRSGSSHYVYTKGQIQITVPYKKPYVKEIYIKRITEIIEEIYEPKES